MLVAAALMLAAPAAAKGALSIHTLSSRPDLVSGGDVLVEIAGGGRGVTLSLNGKDVTGDVRLDPQTHTLRGVVSGLADGKNTLTARAGAASASLIITNHPITGPILSGPHMTPYECRTEESGLGKPLDADCSAADRVDFFYRTTGGAFRPLARRTDRPADLATATTIDGASVPYVVRVESGTVNRSIYRIAMLDDPKGWNRRLAVSFGGGAGAKYNQGSNTAESALSDLYLSRGFAHAVDTELVNNLHGNGVLQGETLMMLKELFIKRHGVPRWTVGNGGSGGAIQQLVITQMYPGLLDGLQPALSFPDSTLHTADCGLLQRYWRGAGKDWSQAKKTAVEGFTPGTCGAWERSFVPVSDSGNKPGCDLKDASLVWDKTANPKGARCALADWRVNEYGRDPASGYARKTEDNEGLQYGLKALNAGAISVDEFLDLNEKIGGYDNDGMMVSARSHGDPAALKAAYASGLLMGGAGGLADVPILHWRTYNDWLGDIHSRERDMSIRARLQKANGDTENEVFWVGPGGRPGGPRNDPAVAKSRDLMASQALTTMTKWLDALAADPAPLSHAKVVRLKPAEAKDAWFDDAGEKHAEKASWDGPGGYNKTYPNHSEPRIEAGAPTANDVLKCRRKPVDATDYKVRFTPAQLARLKAVFPTGVCDFSKSGVGQVALKGTYQRY
jgi:hypothetical protein